mmetsp:Transcript_77795/g.251791  ORF Transcript_77795/g.251791 Transcript_77795/m.251791 type:complete len:204 (+) Transcript_77795:642-1253(+)
MVRGQVLAHGLEVRRALHPLLRRLEEGHAHGVAHALVLEVREPGVQGVHLLHAGYGQAHEAGEEPDPEAVRHHGGVHAQPHCQQQVHECPRDGHPVEAEHEGWRLGAYPALSVPSDAEPERQCAHGVVHLHLARRELDKVSDVFAEKPEALDLHLQAQQLSVEPLLLVELVDVAVVGEQLLGCDAYGRQELHGGLRPMQKGLD